MKPLHKHFIVLINQAIADGLYFLIKLLRFGQNQVEPHQARLPKALTTAKINKSKWSYLGPKLCLNLS